MNEHTLSLVIQNADTKEIIFNRSQIPENTAWDLQLDWLDVCLREELEQAEAGSTRNYIIYSKFPPSGFSYRLCRVTFKSITVTKTYAGTQMFDEEYEIPYDSELSDPIRLNPLKFPTKGETPSFSDPKELTHELEQSDIRNFLELIKEGARNGYPAEIFNRLLTKVNQIDSELEKACQSMRDEFDENDNTVGGDLMLFLDLGITAWKLGGNVELISTDCLSKYESRINNAKYHNLLESSVREIIAKS